MEKINQGLIFFNDGLTHASAVRRYQERRRRLSRACKMPLIISAVNTEINRGLSWLNLEAKFYQDPLFLYLTGINQPGVILFMDYKGQGPNEVLLVPKRDQRQEFWNGYRLSVGKETDKKQVREITGICEINEIKEFNRLIKERIVSPAQKNLGLTWHESGKSSPVQDSNYDLFKKTVSELKKHGLDPDHILVNIEDKQLRQRLNLDEQDVKNAAQANKIAAVSFENLCRKLKMFRYEYEAAGFLDGQLRYRTPFGQSFPTLAAAGKNASTLHYEANVSPLRKDQLLLLDFGVRCYSMVSDVSRTVPLGGRFNPLQRILYGIVLEAQNLVEKEVRPGNTLNKINKHCWDFINLELKRKITDKGGVVRLPYEGKPHGVGHLMGIAVHDGDASGVYKKRALRTGNYLSNEPGVYGYFELEIDGKKFCENGGIRIEDNLLVTAEGCRNMTKACPKNPAELERLINS